MRIIAGKFRGTKLYMLKDEKTRPLKDMVKESIFNFLIHSNKISFQIEKSNVLDLYSGIGSFGLECLSRGANKVIFIENQKEAIKILRKNIEKIKERKKTEIFCDDVFNVIKKNNKNNLLYTPECSPDVIFCDPPFKNTNINNLIELIVKKKLLKKSTIIIFHRKKNTKEKFTQYLKIIDERVYGISKIIFCKPQLS